MFPLITKPTHISNHSATIVDDIYSNAFVMSHNSAILVNDISDHLSIFTTREENLYISNDVAIVSYMKVRNKGKENIKILSERLAMESWHSVYDKVDVYTAHNNFIQIIYNLFSKYCPIIMAKCKGKNVDIPWMTTGL